jgi:ubiquinone biosynthesis protein UbiJ
MGPNAFNVFQHANVPTHLFVGGTVRDAVEAYKAGGLQSVVGANAQAGIGMGQGRGKGRGMGMSSGAAISSAFIESRPTTAGSREEKIASLRDTAGELRKQLAELMERLDRLEKEE